MSDQGADELEKRLGRFFDQGLAGHPGSDLNAALRLAETLEARGYGFRMKDMCPRSLTDSLWRASFVADGEEFSAEHPQSPVAVCAAALAALERGGVS